MLRKWTLKIFLRVPNQRMTSKISSPGFSQHLGDRALAEVQAVVRALGDPDEPLQAVDAAEHGLDAAKALAARHARIVRMAGEADLVLLGHRHDALEEIGDPLPVDILVDRPGRRQRRILLRLVVDERAVDGAAAPGRRLGAHDAEDGHVVLERRDARARGVADHLADVVDLAVALGALAEHDVRHLGPRDVVGAHRQRHHVERDAERLDVLAKARAGRRPTTCRRAGPTAGGCRCG